jgi:DNA processing protein
VISQNIQVISATASHYPDALRILPDVPDPIYAIGDVSLFDKPLVSIVGTRNPTAYGLRTARALACAFVKHDYAIVSGMARGIDSAAHRTALDSGGSTIAVLGTGVDVPYPVGHTELHRAISQRGLILSENPPGQRAYKGAFPKRNRIIAALGRATIVVEAGHKSGAKNTASHAQSLFKSLGCIPGPIDSEQSAGTNHLIRDGATLIPTIEDALSLAGVQNVKQVEPFQLNELDARVWSAVGCETLSVDAIAVRARLSTRDCLASITSLELSGLVESLITGEVRRRI